jgi:hypothetical protein
MSELKPDVDGFGGIRTVVPFDTAHPTRAAAILAETLATLTDDELVAFQRKPMPLDPAVNVAALILAEWERRR